MTSCRLKVECVGAAKDAPLFQSVQDIEVSKSQLFKHGIMVLDLPESIAEDAFSWFQSKLPHYEAIYGDYIDLEDERIVNRSTGDRGLPLASEIVGVGCGLAYATLLLNAEAKDVTKVPVPSEKRKYMDFRIRGHGGEAEFEAKGTTSEKNVTQMLADIDEKKRGSAAAVKFGTITVARRSADKKPSYLVVTDDPPEEERPRISRQGPVPTLRRIIAHYLVYLSFILDTTKYNQFVRKFFGDETVVPRIDTGGSPQRLAREGVVYVGEYFDRRLIEENVKSLHRPDGSLDLLFRNLTSKFGRTKLFLGLDSRVIELYNRRDVVRLRDYTHELVGVEDEVGFSFVDRDGIAIIKSVNGSDKQIDAEFTEQEVRRRLGYYHRYLTKVPVECGAPCRSRELRGKPCAIKTFRGHCHFHR